MQIFFPTIFLINPRYCKNFSQYTLKLGLFGNYYLKLISYMSQFEISESVLSVPPFNLWQQQCFNLKLINMSNQVIYLPLNKQMFWNLWQERLRFLCPDENGSSKSQTSVASSSTTSTLYLMDSREIVRPNGLKQVWCKFGTGNSQSVTICNESPQSSLLSFICRTLPKSGQTGISIWAKILKIAHWATFLE